MLQLNLQLGFQIRPGFSWQQWRNAGRLVREWIAFWPKQKSLS